MCVNMVIVHVKYSCNYLDCKLVMALYYLA